MALNILKARKYALLGTASVLAMAGSAFAQSSSSGNVEQVVVTGSRIVENGYQSPTPVTVATAADLALSSPTSISDGLFKLPQFFGSAAPNSTSHFTNSAQPVHGNVLNLRGLGVNRTLILLDGVRVPPTSYLNTTDVDILPQLLVQRVDVVTGGASASYGSDAVAGVVNYILNTKFDGIKGEAQAGVTQRGDGQNQRFGLAAGTNVLGDRGHVMFSVEYYNNSGYLNQDRPEIGTVKTLAGSVVGSTASPGAAANPLTLYPDTRIAYATYGGEATTGPFANTNFISSGLYAPVNKGAPTGTGGALGVYQSPSDYITQPATQSAASALRNVNMFGRFSYDLDDDTTAFVQLIGAQSNIHFFTLPNLQFSPVLQIFSGNAFLPAPLQAQLTATNTPSFGYAKLFTDLGNIRTNDRVDNYDEEVGIKGKLGRFDWTIGASHGASIDSFAQSGQINLQHEYAAFDSVISPASGQPVCAASLSTNATVAQRYSNCVAYNPFGFNAASPAADAYLLGTSTFRAENSTNDISGNIAGELFDLPAGPLSAALGAEYRTANLNITSNGNPATPPDFTGLRGVVTPSQWYLTNQGVARGSEQVEEGYFEFAAPILKDMPFIEALNLNGAARVTNYSITGESTTWKIGGTWKIDDELTLRSTRSRDIRAPTLFDLFAGPLTSQAAAVDPHTGINVGFNSVQSGNPNLKPEVGNTLTAGFSYQPAWLPGFAGSVDYYNIEMKRAITTLATLAILQDCESSGGTAPSCAVVTRPLPFSDHTSNNVPSLIQLSGINAARVKTDGVDVDASYKTSLWGGDLTARTYLSYVAEVVTQLTAQQPLINYAGWNAGGSGGVAGAIPHFKGTFSLNYTYGDYGIFAQEDMIGGLKLGPTLFYTQPQLPSYFMTDLTMTWHAPPVWGANTQIFGSITNLFDEQPPIVGGGNGGALDTIQGLYDTTGRAFVVGVKFDTN